MIAHVLTGSPIPAPVEWLVAMLLFGGALTLVLVRRRMWRLTALLLTVCGAAGTLTSWVVAAVQPGIPPYGLRIVSPSDGAGVASPVFLTVCGVRGDGTMVPATDAAHYLVVFVDGHEVPTVDSWRFQESLGAGRHTIRVELVTPAHHAFTPPALASTTVTVGDTDQAPSAARC